MDKFLLFLLHLKPPKLVTGVLKQLGYITVNIEVTASAFSRAIYSMTHVDR